MNTCAEIVLIACDEENSTSENYGERAGWTDGLKPSKDQPEARPAAAPQKTGRRILIVEDQNDLAMCMELFLNDVGHEVAIAPTARRAHELLGSRPFDLVLLDVDLPDGNGFDICRWIREDAATANLPVVFCTGRDPAETTLRAKELNAGVLFKVFTMDELLTAVQAARRGGF